MTYRNRSLVWMWVLGAASCSSNGTAPEVADSARSVVQAPQEPSLEGFTARDASDDERLAALEGLAFPNDEWLVALLAVGSNPDESDRLRWEALRRHPVRDESTQAILAILDDPANGGAELNANLAGDLVSKLRLRTRDAELAQNVYRVYRKLLRDERSEVRIPAFRSLVTAGDELAIEMTRSGLRDPNEALIPADEGLRLLDANGAASHLDVIRPYLDAEQVEVQAAAVRALTDDGQSRDAIRTLLSTRGTPQRVRLAAIDALGRTDDAFIDSVVRILDGPREAPELQSAAVRAYVGRLNYESRPAAEQVRFAESLDGLLSRMGESFLRGSDDVVPYLRQNFPAIDGYFESR